VFTDRQDPVLENASLQPLANQTHDPLIADTVLHESNEPFVAHRVEGNVNRLPISKTFLKR